MKYQLMDGICRQGEEILLSKCYAYEFFYLRGMDICVISSLTLTGTGNYDAKFKFLNLQAT